MEEIISFIMGNIHFVVIAGFFLFSLLGKSNKDNSKRRPSMPEFGGGADPVHSYPPVASEAPREQRAMVESDERSVSSERSGSTSWFGEEQAPMIYSHPTVAPVAVPKQNKQRRTTNQVQQRHVSVQPYARQHALNKQQLRKAVIWSEVLARPRSLQNRRK
ncbi:hypothetical protein ACFSTH_05185 [Paenibacillus yanchengensis]|uniref:Uncharacterized protein n=1 Tax=Paenibacillus yanchengensis TaxID=2035833 RepID=A0ABW4YK60_9BACL